jgi:penicillin-binding protein 1A
MIAARLPDWIPHEMSRQARNRRRRRNRVGAPQALMLTLGALAVVGVVGIVGATLYVISVVESAPSLASVHPLVVGTPSEVVAADGTRLGFIQSDNLRTPVTWNQIPERLAQATIAIEDQRFYHNDGIDVTAIVRAALADVSHGATLQGASTITMQLVRNLYLGNDLRTFKQKVTEAKLALEYNNHHTKREVLTNYLNDIAYGTVGGQTAIGVQAASLILFNKPVRKLDLAEAALLAGLPRPPTTRCCTPGSRANGATWCSRRWRSSATSRPRRPAKPSSSRSASTVATTTPSAAKASSSNTCASSSSNATARTPSITAG